MSEVAASEEPNGASYNSDHTHRVILKPCKPFNALLRMGALRIEPVGLPKGETDDIEEDNIERIFCFL